MHSRRKQREEVHLEPLIGWKIGRWAGVGDGRLGLRLVHGQGQGQGPGVVQSRLSDAFRGLSRLHVRPMTWRRFQSMACPACCVHTSVRRDKKKVRGPLGPPSVDPLAPHRWTPWPPLCGPLGPPPSVDPLVPPRWTPWPPPRWTPWPPLGGPLGPPSVDPLVPPLWTPWPPLCGPLGRGGGARN